MALETWLAFVLASCLLLIIPGPTVLILVSCSVTHGRRAHLPLVAAVALGDATALAASLFGLGALLAVSAAWFSLIKIIGGSYLIYLGMRMLLAGVMTNPIATSRAVDCRWKLFLNTWLITALNPKGMVFFMAFLPQFVSPGENVTSQLWLLAFTFVVLATINAALYVVFTASARDLLARPEVQGRFNLFGGSLLIGAGLWAFMVRQQT